ncbi:MAG TPA: AtpZ/AtpI family protein [Acidimicrobiia bacterium]|nr:AtpZ/AtpI family protein [Acidimicrobiia bacterium]
MSDSGSDRFPDSVGRKAKRRIAAREKREDVWFWMGMFGLVGWSVAIPTLLGVALGWWLDETWPQDFSWTLTLLVGGLGVGCLNAWFWVRQESRRD